MLKTKEKSRVRRVGRYQRKLGFGGKNHPWEREANYALAMGLMQTMFAAITFPKVKRLGSCAICTVTVNHP